MEGCLLLLLSSMVRSSLSPYWLSVIINHYMLHRGLIECMDHHKGGKKKKTTRRGQGKERNKL